jgi:hypothetical protein
MEDKMFGRGRFLGTWTRSFISAPTDRFARKPFNNAASESRKSIINRTITQTDRVTEPTEECFDASERVKDKQKK